MAPPRGVVGGVGRGARTAGERPGVRGMQAQLFEVQYEGAFCDALLTDRRVHALVAVAEDGELVGVASARSPRSQRSWWEWVRFLAAG